MNAFSRLRPSVFRARGFTLLEMMLTMVIFILLAAAVFGIIVGVFQESSTLQDNQNHRDQVAAFNAFLKKKLAEMPAQSTFVSYQRGNGEGLTQNGVIFGEDDQATAIDAKVQANGYYTLRLTSITPGDVSAPPGSSLATILAGLVGQDNSSLVWSPLIRDVQTLHWQFQDVDATQWVDLWNNTSVKPNLVEFSMQIAGDLQPVTMDFWLPRLAPISVIINPPVTNAP